jgi:hypothetical protein
MARKRVSLRARLERTAHQWTAGLGPGIVTGAADDDPSGIATYSQAPVRLRPVVDTASHLSVDVGGAAGGQRAHRPGHRKRPRRQPHPRWAATAVMAAASAATLIDMIPL